MKAKTTYRGPHPVAQSLPGLRQVAYTDEAHTPDNKCPGAVDSSLVFGARRWDQKPGQPRPDVELFVSETTKHPSGKVTTKTITFDLTPEIANAISRFIA